MELKIFQQKVINDLQEFLEILNSKQKVDIAFSEYWQAKGVNVGFGGLSAYKNNIKNVPHVCFKVPTGGGKTFIACNSIKPVFDAMPFTKTKAVVWLVPSNTILEQTIENLKNTDHPYRQKINVDFNGRVEIYTKGELLNAQGFNPTAVSEQLSIFVLSYDTFRSRKKEDRKIYQENGNLKPFVQQ
jgi:type III restriction enzyme